MNRRYKHRRMQNGGDPIGVRSMRPIPPEDFNFQQTQQPINPVLNKESLNQQSVLHGQNEIIKQLQLNNQQLESQNTLLETQIELEKKINEARSVVKTTTPGSKNSPKKTGGGKNGLISLQQAKDKKTGNWIIASSNAGMKRGGALPGGRYFKR